MKEFMSLVRKKKKIGTFLFTLGDSVFNGIRYIEINKEPISSKTVYRNKPQRLTISHKNIDEFIDFFNEFMEESSKVKDIPEKDIFDEAESTEGKVVTEEKEVEEDEEEDIGEWK